MSSGWLDLCLCTDLKYRIVRHFVENPKLRQNQAHVARSIRRPQISVSRSIRDLVKLRILHEERHGKSVIYSLNEKSALVRRFLIPIVELEDRFLANWVHEQVALLPATLRKELERVVVFGSAARGEQTPLSDVDLLAVVHRVSDRLEQTLHSTLVGKGSEEGLKISLLIESVREFNSPARSGYLTKAKDEGIVLWPE